jgi:hypothetical protein
MAILNLHAYIFIVESFRFTVLVHIVPGNVSTGSCVGNSRGRSAGDPTPVAQGETEFDLRK